MDKRAVLLAYGLILLGILARLAPHPPNVTPVVAVALFSGAVLPRRWSLVVPLAIMGVSDWLIGFTPQMISGWLAFLLVGCLGWLLRQRRSVPRLVLASLSSSTLFFLVSNFGVWLEGRLYPLTLAGLRDCYVAGIPFYRNMLAGDLCYTAVFFGLFGWVSQWQRQPAIVSSR